MGFNNPDVPWSQIERTLSDRPRPKSPGSDRRANGRSDGSLSWNAGGDGPAWTRKRQPYQAPAAELSRGGMPYAELHCHSNFSFLDGASHPEELAEEAARLGLAALALTDHNGFYGVVRFAEAARAVGMPTVFGAELSLGMNRPPNGEADPHGQHLLVLADGPAGYASLARAISLAQLAGEKGAPSTSIEALGEHAGHWFVLTGCRKGTVPAALIADGPAAATAELQRLVDAFGHDRVVVELWDHGHPLDAARNDALAELAVRNDLACVATNNVHYATPARRPRSKA